MAGKPLYAVWQAIKQRCENPANEAFANYGGRGIRICAEWSASFAAFYAYLGERPSQKHTVERSDNDRGYEPGNVVWATRTEQARNRRGCRFITANGVTRTLAEWIELSEMSASAIEHRLARGWQPAEAVTAPSRKPQRA